MMTKEPSHWNFLYFVCHFFVGPMLKHVYLFHSHLSAFLQVTPWLYINWHSKSVGVFTSSFSGRNKYFKIICIYIICTIFILYVYFGIYVGCFVEEVYMALCVLW